MTRPVVAFDANILVAGLLSWHVQHTLVRPILVEWLGHSPKPVVPVQALVEAWAVMTRMPTPHGVSAADAASLLDGALKGRCRLGVLAEADGWRMLDALLDGKIVGGLAYDLQIVTCARAAGATRLYTCNERDFGRLTLAGIEIVNPLRPDRGA